MRTDADKGVGGQNRPIFCGRPLCTTPKSVDKLETARGTSLIVNDVTLVSWRPRGNIKEY